MNITRSSNKHQMSTKDYQVLTIQHESKGSKPNVKGRTQTAAVSTCVKKQGTSSSLDPAPSNLPFQGGKGFSQPSSELSSSEGVWLPIKWKRKGKKMKQRRSGKTGELKASLKIY